MGSRGVTQRELAHGVARGSNQLRQPVDRKRSIGTSMLEASTCVRCFHGTDITHTEHMEAGVWVGGGNRRAAGGGGGGRTSTSAVSSEKASQASRMVTKRCRSAPVSGLVRAESSGRSVRSTSTSCSDDCGQPHACHPLPRNAPPVVRVQCDWSLRKSARSDTTSGRQRTSNATGPAEVKNGHVTRGVLWWYMGAVLAGRMVRRLYRLPELCTELCYDVRQHCRRAGALRYRYCMRCVG